MTSGNALKTLKNEKEMYDKGSKKKTSTHILKAEKTGAIHMLSDSQVDADIENKHHGPSDAMPQSLPDIRVSPTENLSHLSQRYTRYLLTSHSEIVDIE
ncbi:hypothetical protein Tco_1300877 [Tanacetum coccineum]